MALAVATGCVLVVSCSSSTSQRVGPTDGGASTPDAPGGDRGSTPDAPNDVGAADGSANGSVIAAAPTAGETLAAGTTLTAQGTSVPVYVAPTNAVWPGPLGRAPGLSPFAQFDMSGSVRVVVSRSDVVVATATVKTIVGGVPTTVTSSITSSTVSFTVAQPGQYLVTINGDWQNSMEIFANPVQTNVPRTSAANVQVVLPGTFQTALTPPSGKDTLYLGPGQYFLTGEDGVQLGAGQQLYMADGAFLYLSHLAQHEGVGMFGAQASFQGRGVVDGSRQASVASFDGFSITSGVITVMTTLDPNAFLAGDSVTLAVATSGYSYLNGARLTVLPTGLTATSFQAAFANADVAPVSGLAGTVTPAYAPTMIAVNAVGAVADGFVCRDAPKFNVEIAGVTGGATANNFKVLGRRLNTDGVHVDSSVGAVVSNAFIRTFDDEVCINNNSPALATSNFSVSNVLLFVQKAHGVLVNIGFQSVTDGTVRGVYMAENRSAEPDPAIGVLVVDQGVVGPSVLIEDISADAVQNFLSVVIDPTNYFSVSHMPGSVNGVTFRSIAVPTPAPPAVTLTGYDATHLVDDVVFDNVTIQGAPLTLGQVTQNAFVANTVVMP